MQAVVLSTRTVGEGTDESILEQLAEILNADTSIQHSIKTILANKNRWLIIEVKSVNSHTGRLDSHSRGNQYADELATAACKDNFSISAAEDHNP